MTRLIIDTNIWLDLLVFDEPRMRPLHADLAAGRVRCHHSPHLFSELADVLTRPQFGLDARAQGEAMAQARMLSQLESEPAQPAPLRCRDPDDQPFLDLAFALRAEVLLSKDKALLALARKARPYQLTISAQWPPNPPKTQPTKG